MDIEISGQNVNVDSRKEIRWLYKGWIPTIQRATDGREYATVDKDWEYGLTDEEMNGGDLQDKLSLYYARLTQRCNNIDKKIL